MSPLKHIQQFPENAAIAPVKEILLYQAQEMLADRSAAVLRDAQKGRMVARPIGKDVISLSTLCRRYYRDTTGYTCHTSRPAFATPDNTTNDYMQMMKYIFIRHLPYPHYHALTYKKNFH